MNRFFYSSVTLLVSLFIISCISSKSVVSQNVDLKKYEYASIVNNETYRIPAELMEFEIQLFDAVEGSGLKLISDRRIYELTSQQQSRLLLVKYGVRQTEEKSTVSINFIDYMTGRPIVSCSGGYGLGMSHAGDLRGAIKQVAKQISETFHK